MKILNSKGYATLITIITIGLLCITILGILNLQSLNRKSIQSNENSIRAYYIGESGIQLLQQEVDLLFESYCNEYIENQRSIERITPSNLESEELIEENSVSFRDFVMLQENAENLQVIRKEENIFNFYTDIHGWRLESLFQADHIELYSTGYYEKTRKRIIALISYPDLIELPEESEEKGYSYQPSEILSYLQGYESDALK